MNRNFLAALVVMLGMTIVPNASATSPYDLPYKVQWNFQIGNDGADNPTAVETSSDSSAWIATGGTGTGGGLATWGGSKSGTTFDSGYGQVSGTGAIMQGMDLPNVTDNVGQTQALIRGGLSMQGTTAFYSWDPSSSSNFWDNQSPAQSASQRNPMTLSVEPVALAQGAPYDNVMPTQYKKNIQLLSNSNARQHESVVSQSSNEMWFVGGYQGAGDRYTVGDNSIGATVSYSPEIGKVAANGITLTGPAKQPVTDGRGWFDDVSVNEGTGRIYASGFAFNAGAATTTFFDADGDGTADHNFSPSVSADRGFGVVYDSSFNVLHSVAWESAYGGERVFDNVASSDGGFIMAGRTMGSMTSYTNPSPGVYDVYAAKYNSSGTLVWDYQSETASEDEANSVSVDSDGNVYLGIEANNGADDDVRVIKLTSSGTVVWTTTIDNAGSQDAQVDHANVSKNKIYALSETDPSIGGVWSNSHAYVPQGTDEVLLQKLIPGDFNASDNVNSADVYIALAAVGSSGLPGVDTYDFDENGDSDEDDIYFQITEVMDYYPGDADLDGEVDNADWTTIDTNATTPLANPFWTDGDFNNDNDVDYVQLVPPGSGDMEQWTAHSGFGPDGLSDVGADVGANTAEALYNSLTGELLFDVGTGIGILGLVTNGLNITGNVDGGALIGTARQNDGDFLVYAHPIGLPVGEGSVGLVLPTGLSAGDLTFVYTPFGLPTVEVPVTVLAKAPSDFDLDDDSLLSGYKSNSGNWLG